MPDRLFYVVAYGPMHKGGVWARNVIAESKEGAARSSKAAAPEGYAVERVAEYTQAPPPDSILNSAPILNSPLTLGEWWRSQQAQPDTTSEAAGQASLF